MEQTKYHSIVRYGHRSTVDVLNAGDQIVIEEKLDGSNVSVVKDKDKIRAFSRNTELNEENTLGGFYQFSQSLNADDLLDEIVYFGEFLNPHKVRYPNFEKQFFLFDLYDLETDKYLPFSKVKEEAQRLNLNLVPVFYEGKYQSFEHLQSFVGRTNIGGRLGDVEQGEGVVIKNVDYIDRYGRQVFVKLVTDAFREVQKQKPAKDPKTLTPEQLFVNTCVTEARVEKILYKLVDEGILEESFGIEDMGDILKNMNVKIYEDIMKEEAEMLEEYEDKQIRKAIGRKLPQMVRGMLRQKK